MVLHSRVGEVSAGRLDRKAEVSVERRYRRKSVLRDEGAAVTVLKPLPEGMPEATEGAELREDVRVLEVALVPPTFDKVREIKMKVKRGITLPQASKVVEFVIPDIRYSPTPFTQVSVCDIAKDILYPISSVREALLSSLRAKPTVEFQEAEAVMSKAISREMCLEVKPATLLLNYVHYPRVAFHKPYGVRGKSLGREVVARTISPVYSPSEEWEVLVEELDPLERVLGLPFSRAVSYTHLTLPTTERV